MIILIYLWKGGLAETPLHGGLVGPTFACIIGIQFRNLRKCDRFWYENSNPLIRFTEAQLAEVRKMTLSKILCDNCDQVNFVVVVVAAVVVNALKCITELSFFAYLWKTNGEKQNIILVSHNTLLILWFLSMMLKVLKFREIIDLNWD